MKLLLNDKEIANFLMSLVDHTDAVLKLEFPQPNIELAIEEIKKETSKRTFNLAKKRGKIKHRIQRAVDSDLKDHKTRVREFISKREKFFFEQIKKHLEFIINKLGEDTILELYANSNVQNFVKTVGQTVSEDCTLIRRKDYNIVNEDCVLRNTVGNESLLVSKIDNQYPFWFIDSGYTNFLEPSKKKWHRLVRNHLHQYKNIEVPVDRLGNLASFPRQWRQEGEIILVVEPGPLAAGIFHVDLKTWKYDVEAELRKYTDKKIVFREKAPKKQRTPLHKELHDDDYYCLVNINSNAATEALWAGVPVITLDKHITNPVSCNKLSDINNLYRGNLANWLALLSYSQFTFEELMNGTAVEIVKKYHV
jgi:hypothetical protein